jgi:protein kinase-like protein
MQQFSDRKERILPVRLEDVAPPHLIAPIAYVDLFPDEQAFHRGIARLTRSIAMHTARHATTDDAGAERSRSAADALPAASAASVSRAMARNAASPTPAYLDAEVQALSEQLERARERKRNLRDSGIAADRVGQEILELRRKLRDGGQLRAGDSLGDGRYLLVKPVGRGGFAVVWEAWDRGEQQRVAIKVLHQHLASDPQRRERFFRGARVMMELNHPAVVRVHDPGGQDDSFCYFVMELVPGGDLREAVLGKRVAAERWLALILQVGEALAQALLKDRKRTQIRAHQQWVATRRARVPEQVDVDPVVAAVEIERLAQEGTCDLSPGGRAACRGIRGDVGPVLDVIQVRAQHIDLYGAVVHAAGESVVVVVGDHRAIRAHGGGRNRGHGASQVDVATLPGGEAESAMGSVGAREARRECRGVSDATRGRAAPGHKRRTCERRAIGNRRQRGTNDDGQSFHLDPPVRRCRRIGLSSQASCPGIAGMKQRSRSECCSTGSAEHTDSFHSCQPVLN